MADALRQLTAAVAALSRRAIPTGSGAMGLPPMRDFTALCEEMFPDTMGIAEGANVHRESGRFALINLLRSTGLPSNASGPSSEAVARAIIEAMTTRSWARVHLCPLDMAGDLPALTFGPCMIREFKRKELETLLQMGRLRRSFQNLRLDTSGLADFHWLVVREEKVVARPAGSRAFPWFDFQLDKDFGAVNPHPREWPEIVEQAVFGLMQLPWEEMVDDPEIEWRGFRIPWIYTVDHDPFVASSLPRGPETLTRQPEIYVDQHTGEEEELERPTRLNLKDGLDHHWRLLDNAWWARLQHATASPIVNPLVAHFMVRAFRSDGIDEFLGQMVAIEAALGMERDHGLAGPKPKIPGKSQGATVRVARRAGEITGDPAAASEYSDLFKLRSTFIHGRPLGEIPSAKRVAARGLARRVVSALLDAADLGLHHDRTSYLTTLCP